MRAAPNIKDSEYKSELLIPLTTNHEISKNEVLNETIVHRILRHAINDEIDKMTSRHIILDLQEQK